MTQLILASSSPRRRDLLEQVNISYETRKQHVDESKMTCRSPRAYVQALAELKARSVPFSVDNEVIISADTVVSFEEQVLGKPKSRKEAFDMLSMLSGNIHKVYTGVTIRSAEQETSFVEKTTVEFWPLTKDEINEYLDSEEPYDKAGAYGIQSSGAIFVKEIKGDYYNVVGLPLSRVVRSLRSYGIFPNLSQPEHKVTGN
ncbi:Maf family protein [Pontibacillus yanchengensis]|uniref:dTTP/UTP pyrophosphatase n=1 Tax=Pontibacillus yanchengensis Y32 TaxID=1385514 RepID=A0A0A2THJ1_9BACI|nr:Maf family protein [Pontibacillus yanchengensis]KGP73883.1 septum formation protein Maf [Pontibacillus yanchengensis Y32]